MSDPQADPHAITTVDELRAIVGEPHPLTRVKIKTALGDQARAFLASCPFVVLGTAGPEGELSVTPRGDAPGFILVEDDTTIVIPERTGNKLAIALQHILAGSRVALFALRPGTGETLRLGGRARLTRDPALLERLSARGKPALLAIRITVESCYFHCAKALLRSSLWDPATWPEPMTISFGREIKPKIEAIIDAAVTDDYKNL
jgi:PPOX class probable FMN-dependent enzyme